MIDMTYTPMFRNWQTASIYFEFRDEEKTFADFSPIVRRYTASRNNGDNIIIALDEHLAWELRGHFHDTRRLIKMSPAFHDFISTHLEEVDWVHLAQLFLNRYFPEELTKEQRDALRQ